MIMHRTRPAIMMAARISDMFYPNDLQDEIFAYWDYQVDCLPQASLLKTLIAPLITHYKRLENGWNGKDGALIAQDFIIAGIGAVIFFLITLLAGLWLFSGFIPFSIVFDVVAVVIGFIVCGSYATGYREYKQPEKDTSRAEVRKQRTVVQERKNRFYDNELFRIEAAAEYYETVKIPRRQKQVSDLKSKVEQRLNLETNKMTRDREQLQQAIDSGKFTDHGKLRKLTDAIERIDRDLLEPSEEMRTIINARDSAQDKLRGLEAVTRSMRAYIMQESEFQVFEKIADKYSSDGYESVNPSSKLRGFIDEFDEIGASITADTEIAHKMINTGRELSTGDSPVTKLIAERSGLSLDTA